MILSFALSLALLFTYMPSMAVPQQAQPQQSATDIPLQFDNNNVATVGSWASSSQEFVYTFFGTVGDTVLIELSPQTVGLSFGVTGQDGATYRPLGPAGTFRFDSVPVSQIYRITIFNSSSSPVFFTLRVTRGPGTGTAQRIPFLPGQTTATVTGLAGPGQNPPNPQYIFTLPSQQQVRIRLISLNNLAQFSLRGANNVTYTPPNPGTDWTSDSLPPQDYIITVTSSQPVSFQLEVSLLNGPFPADRITLGPNGTQVVSGNLPAGGTKYYVLNAAANQQIRFLLVSTPATSINFGVEGVSDRIRYKELLPSGPREWTLTTPPSPSSQDYQIVLYNFGAGPADYSLEVILLTITPTPTSTITPLPPLPTGCVNTPLQNGGFENDGFWVFGDDPVPPAYVGSPVQTGLRSVRLGIDPALGSAVQNKKSFSSIRQPILIPSEAITAQLRWYHFYRTEEPQTDDPSSGTDQQQVILLNPDLSTHAVLVRVRRNDNAWVADFRDLTSFRGKSLILYFNVYNDGNGQRTWQFLDEVYLYACYPEVTPTPIAPTSTPTPTPTATPTPTTTPTTTMSVMAAPLAPMPPATSPAPSMSTTSPPLTSPGQTTNGEPTVDLLASAQAGQAAQDEVALAVAATQRAMALAQAQTQVQAQIQSSQPQPVATATPQVSTRNGLRIFNRPAAEVLTWLGIMLGAVAVIGILAALIWQASQREDTGP